MLLKQSYTVSQTRGSAFNKLIITVLLAVVSSNAIAEWVNVGGTEAFNIYVNSSTIRKNREKVIVWEVLDFSSARIANGQTFLSIKTQREYDCQQMKSQVLESTFYSGNMGRGNAFNSDFVPAKRSSISPDSIEEMTWEHVCSKK